jgi:hypothetical protein
VADAEVPPAEVEATTLGIGQLAAALAAVQLELPSIRKAETGEVSGTNKDGKFFSYKYSYADLAAVSAAIMPLLGKNGLAFTAWPTSTLRGLALRYHLIHKSGEHMDGEYPLPAGDRVTAQQLGSAITYARRYCLCAVTGVAPDDDDDAAAAEGQKASRRAEQQEEISAELSDARDKVRGAWAVQFGAFDQAAASELYRKWAQGKGTLTGATAGQLSNFAGYLHTLPAVDAGSDPNEATHPPPGDEDAPSAGGGKMTVKQRGQLFVLLGQIGLTSKPDQLGWINKQLNREYESRTEITFDDAKQLIDALMTTGVDVAPEDDGTR